MNEINADGTTLCPLCSRTARVTDAGRLYRHFSREQSMRGHRAVPCKASRHTLPEARNMARQVAEELEALRLRAHP